MMKEGLTLEIASFCKDDILQFEKQIRDLLKYSLDVSFPEEHFPDFKINKYFEQLLQYIGENAYLYVANRNATIDGLIWFYIRGINIKKLAYVNFFVVSEEKQGKGIGRTLFSEMEKFLLSKSINEINLQVSAKNKNAVNFYKRNKFIEDKVIMMKTF